MRTRLALVLTILALAPTCKRGEPRLKAIVGGTLIDGTDAPPLSGAVVVIDGTRIRAVGPRAATPIPAGSETTDAAGRFIVPGLIDIAGTELPEVATLADVEKRVADGATAFIGIVSDTKDVPEKLMATLRDRSIVFGPRLTRSKGFAAENTKRFADFGIPIAVATSGQMSTELKAMHDAGLTNAQLIVAVTRNGARAIGKKDEAGTIEPGKAADMLVLAANPLDDIGNLRKFERRMVAGHWQQPRK